MADQYLSAFAVDPDALHRTIGSRDDTVIRAALAALPELASAERLLRATDPGEVEAALTEIVTGRLDAGRPGGYTWLLELLGPVLGTPLGAAVLPGRGWHRLDTAFRAWDLPTLAALWGRPWRFPGLAPDPFPWPFPALAPPTELPALRAELAAFDSDRVDRDHTLLPSGDEDDAEEVVWLLDDLLPAWTEGAARTEGTALLLIRDGAQ
ncbi:hypothetical protein AB0O01_34830 [Streptomyces sp. NPDC093252]|uniref:DUF7691 family protein n=1 Tax=Streptomyces sp. NPDC093252 TaxID=3154980 RepID=UPI003417C826